jgi:L-aminopeptidase/D-esterase-like protein
MMKSGLGIYAVQLGKIKCGVVTAVNSLGDIIDYDTKKIIAGILSEDRKSLSCTKKIMYQEIERSRNVFAGNTSIGCVVTNAKLDKDQACKTGIHRP